MSLERYRKYHESSYGYESTEEAVAAVQQGVEEQICFINNEPLVGSLNDKLLGVIQLQSREAWLRKLADLVLAFPLSSTPLKPICLDGSGASALLRPDKNEYRYLPSKAVTAAFEEGIARGSGDLLKIITPAHEDEAVVREIYYHSWSEYQLMCRSLREGFLINEPQDGPLSIERATRLPHVAVKYTFLPEKTIPRRDIIWTNKAM